jgi:integrase
VPTARITKRSVEAFPLPAPGKRTHLWDDQLKGFGLMVTSAGARSYVVQYRVGGRSANIRRVVIGKHGSPWTAERARRRAEDLLELVRKKVDPFEAERERLIAERAATKQAQAAEHAAAHLAFAVVADRFVEKYAKVEQPRTWKETESIIRRDLKPHFADTPLPAITDTAIIDLLDKVQNRGDSASIKAYKAMRALFGWAKDRRQIPINPMLDIKPPAKVGKRDRALTDAELKLVWQAASSLGWPFGPIVHLLILTGQRLREVAEAPWTEFDLEKRQWVLPGGERTKNGLPNLVPLSDQAMAILKDLPVVASKKRLLFTTTGETPVSGFSKTKTKLDSRMVAAMQRDAEEAGMDAEETTLQPWTIHDLRRTVASGCQRLGIKLEVTEAVLNHVSGSRGGLVGVYQVYRYETEKADALAAWGRHVQSVVHGKVATSNVVPLVAAG